MTDSDDTADGIDMQSVDDVDDDGDELFDTMGGHTTPLDVDVNYTLSGNVARDLVKYVRGNTIRNEQQFLLTVLGYLTGYFTDSDHYVSGMLIGTSSSGKTHVMKQIEDLFHEDHLYQATTGSDKSLIYDGQWNEAHIASLDELQKMSDILIEFLKSCHGDDENFQYKVTPDSAEKREAEEVQTIEREAKPYWFLFAQFDADFELNNRLLKVPVHESESKNRAVGMLSADHYYIDTGDDTDYGYDFVEGTRALQAHIQSIPHKIETDTIPGRVFLPNGDESVGFDWDVWEIVEPIFNHSRSEVNRIYDMVFNLIRASALLNYKNREKQYLDVPNHDSGRYIIAEPQDVANVLACRDALLATTHELDDKKRKICSAIEQNTGKGNEADMATIVEGLESTDMSMLNRTELRNHLEKLHENYLIEIVQGGSDDGADTYKFLDWDQLGFARVLEHDELFDDVFDPVSGQPFEQAHEQLRDELETTGQDLTQGADTTVSSNENKHDDDWFGTGGSQVDLDPHEEAVRQYAREALDGTRVTNLDDVPVEALLGLTSLDDPDRAVDTDGTPLDPTDGCWYQPDRSDDWVEDESDARRYVKEAIRHLIDEGVIVFDEVHEVNKSSEPVDVTFAVLSNEDL
jgi:hypothetical protein